MKILQVVPYFPPAYGFGGPVYGAYQISRELARRGHEVTVYTSDARSSTERLNIESPKLDQGVRVYYFRNISIKLVKWSKLFIMPDMFPKSREEIKLFDIIHLHEYRTFQFNPLVHYYARKYGVPYILQIHGSLPRIMGKLRLKQVYDIFFGRVLLKDASKVIALNKTEVRQLKGLGLPEEKIATMPNGIDVEDYKDLPPKGSFRSRFSVDEDKKIILYIGRIHKIKGLDLLVKAYAYLLGKLKLRDTLLVIVGPDDGFLGELSQLLHSLKMDYDRVLFTGLLDERMKLEAYVDADVFVLPSRYEAFPYVILEAYACSKPVIASNVWSIPDIVLQGKTGLLFQKGNAKELGEAIAYILTHSDEAREMGREGRRLVEERFSLKRLVDSLETLYEEILREER